MIGTEASVSEYLERHFHNFEPALKKVLAEKCILKTFDSGELLMHTGQYFKSTMLVVDGKVKLYREGADSGEFFMYYIEPGEACALSMVCAAKNESSEVIARAVEPTKVLMVPISLMDELMREYKSWYYFVLDTYRSRFEELLQVIDHVVFKGLDERLEFYLKNQHEKLKTRELKVTHQEIANDLNSSREVISRLLKKMEQNRMLKLHRNYIEWLQ